MKNLLLITLLTLVGCGGEAMIVVKPAVVSDDNMASSIPEPDPLYDPEEWAERQNWEQYDDSANGFDGSIFGAARDLSFDLWQTIVDGDTVRRTDSLTNPVAVNYVATTATGNQYFVDIAYMQPTETYWLVITDTADPTTVDITEFNMAGGPATGRSFTLTLTGELVTGIHVTDEGQIALLFDTGGDDFDIRFFSTSGNEDTEAKISGKSRGLRNESKLTSDGINYYFTATSVTPADGVILSIPVSGGVVSIKQTTEVPLFPQVEALEVYGDTVYACGRYSGNNETFTARYESGGLKPEYWLAGDRATVVSEHSIYESVTNNNESPEVGVTKTPATWQRVSATNKYKMFDKIINSQAVRRANSSFQIDITPATSDGVIDSLAIFNIGTAVSAINVTVEIDSEIVYDETIQVTDRSNVVDWWTYWFAPINRADKAALFNIPGYFGSNITLTIESDADDSTEVAVGEVFFGRMINLGTAEHGTTWELLDYNRRERDEFGNLTISENRNTADKFNYTVFLPASQAGYVRQQLKELAGVKCVYVGAIGNNDSLAYGVHDGVTMNFATNGFYNETIRVEGLI